jgi:hypothetical protein
MNELEESKGELEDDEQDSSMSIHISRTASRDLRNSEGSE